jgi:thioredoxin-related protein
MRKYLTGTAAALCVAFAALTTGFADEGWIVDFEAAKELAAKEGKDILMEFTGSDWCPPCIALKKKVLDTDVFKTKAPEKFILLKLDSPRDKSKQTPAEIAQYRKLSEEFKITGVPTIILADAKGRPFAKMVGFGGQEPDAYVSNLTEQQSVRTKRDEALAKAEKAEGTERAKLLDSAISGIESELAVAQYRDLVDEIVKLDGENQAGLKAKYEEIIKSGEVRKALLEIRRSVASIGPDETLKKVEELIEKMAPTGEGLQEALLLKAMLLFRNEKDKSKETLEAAAKVAPESRMGKQIQQILATQFKDEPAGEKKEEKTEAKDEKKEEK